MLGRAALHAARHLAPPAGCDRPQAGLRSCELRRLYGGQWQLAKLDRLLVHPDTVRAIASGAPLDSVVDTYRGEQADFLAKRDKYLLYDACEPRPPQAPAGAPVPTQ